MDTTATEFDSEVIEQLSQVRSSGMANMLSLNDVQIAANALECYALVVFAEDVKELPQSERGKTWMAALQSMR
jgi:hypothetical protein